MKTITVTCAALLLLTSACHQEDTGGRVVWGRTVEPRLSITRSWHACTTKLSPSHVVKEARCAVATVVEGRCDDVIDSRDDADRMLLSRPQCTNQAVAALENLSRADAAAMSDLAGAYYVRAQRNDTPADLLSAFDAAQRAVAMNPPPPGASFNLALILEALSLDAEAVVAWQRAAAAETGEWADEARAHLADLARKRSLNGEQRWQTARAAIDAALYAGDRNALERLVASFPDSSERYFEESVLPQRSMSVKLFAEALSGFFHDRYFVEVAGATDSTGWAEFARARAAERAIDFRAAAMHYDAAARHLRKVGNPEFLLARIGHAGQNALVTDDYGAAMRELDEVAAEGRRYPTVVARVALSRINIDQFLNRYDDLFTAYDAAAAAYGRIGGWEELAAANARTIAAMSVVGLRDAAWRQGFASMRDVRRLPNERTCHLLIGATADAVLNLGHPAAALAYQNVLVESARRQTSKVYLVSALDHRAAIEVRLQRYDDAERDLEAASRMNAQIVDLPRRGLEARLAEIRAEAALHVDPNRAIALFTRAIDAASKSEFATFRAMLFAQRADAFRRLGRHAEEEADRREALDRLHAEEEALLRRRGAAHEDLWNSYFSRFEETYDLLIRQLVEEGRADEAFRYAERGRAFEPLDLVRNLPTAPAKFRELAKDPDHLDLAALREQLPRGTFLIEYRVLDDRTYAWIVGRDLFTVVATNARRTDAVRWTAALQNAAREKDSAAFEAGLYAPYEALLKAPADVIRRAGGATANVVIIPDRELRGMPFAALRDPDTKRYFIEDHALSISGSALLYVYSILRDGALASRDARALLVGDPAFDPHATLAQGLQRLPFAQNEIEHLRTLYPASDVLMGDAATPAQFFRLAPGHALIHIAAHAIVNGDAPSQSFLLFNGFLNADALMKELHAGTTRLVVLGACSSAGGLPVGSEGIAPLVRPMLHAGIPGVVGALWDIDDATAAGLLVSFHRHYRRGEDAAEALRQAQLEFLRSRNPGRMPARFWAPFESIGYASSPFGPVGDITKEKPP